MNSRRKLQTWCAAMLTCLATCAQNPNDAIPKIIPPSPNAAALEKFGTIPVDYSTGIPSISYPMWAWQRGKLQLSLGLSYHAGGHKVDDMAPNTGLGWTLTGLGRVTRTVRSIPDDDAVKGFLYTAPFPDISTYNYDADGYYFVSRYPSEQQAIPVNILINSNNSSNFGLVGNVVNSEIDGEQDVFSFSCNGASGRFVLDKQRNIVLLEQSNTKIEMITNPRNNPLNGESGKIVSFRITDDQGVIYKFEYEEFQRSEAFTDPSSFTPAIAGYVSGWLLTKIIDPISQDSIVINYSSNNVDYPQYETSFSQSRSHDIERIDQIGDSPPVLALGMTVTSDVTSYTAINNNDPIVSSIDLPDNSTVSFGYNFSRADYLNTKALTDVVVRNYQNTVVKRFLLNYSYFTSGSGSYFPGWSVSGNDFNKRLRLDRIDELSADGSIAKPSRFTYNSRTLNPRGSKNIDYWGYNVNPARNNHEYVPRINLVDPELTLVRSYRPDFADSLDGSNRRPDSTYIKAAILEKIEYPTGGFTSFEYEPNQVFNSLYYYDNTAPINTLQWEPNNFGRDYALSMQDNRVDIAVEFLFKTEEYIVPRPQPQPPYTCFDDMQDLRIARFEITSTDGLFSTYYEDTYGRFLGGVKKTLDLPLGKTYRTKFVYDTLPNCSFQYRFKAVASGTYYTPKRDKLTSGLRVKRISSDDGSGNILVKEYNYNDASGHSSAIFDGVDPIANFRYYRTGKLETVTISDDMGGTLTYTFKIHVLNRTSNPTNTLNFNGSPVMYTRVTEIEKDGSSTEREYSPLIARANGGGVGEYPYMPLQDLPNHKGLLTRQVVKDKNGSMQMEQLITWNKIQTRVDNQDNRNLKTGTIAIFGRAKYYIALPYYMFTSRVEQIMDSTIQYENGNAIINKQTKTYDPDKFYLRTITSTNSKRENRVEQLSYAFDGTGEVNTAMKTKNMLNYVTDKVLVKPLLENVVLSRTKTNFQFLGSSAPMIGSVQTAILNEPLQTEITFNHYDDKGNILQYTARDGVATSFIWGYKKQYPVARIIGRYYYDAIMESGINLSVVDNPASVSVMQTELNKLRSLTGAMVTTYVYEPLVGVILETDPKGMKTSYEYDNFNRLAIVRDNDNNIIKRFCYNYQGQPQACGTGTQPVWEYLSSTCQVVNGNFSGYAVVTEKDMNPNSSSYGQSRTYTSTTITADCICDGPDKKVIFGKCETGEKVITGCERVDKWTWKRYYHYRWSNGTISPTYEEPGDCLVIQP